MSTESVEIRLAVVEHSTRQTTERVDRELATKSDVLALKSDIYGLEASLARMETKILKWTIGIVFGSIIVQPFVWIGVIVALQRTGLIDRIFGQ